MPLMYFCRNHIVKSFSTWSTFIEANTSARPNRNHSGLGYGIPATHRAGNDHYNCGYVCFLSHIKIRAKESWVHQVHAYCDLLGYDTLHSAWCGIRIRKNNAAFIFTNDSTKRGYPATTWYDDIIYHNIRKFAVFSDKAPSRLIFRRNLLFPPSGSQKGIQENRRKNFKSRRKWTSIKYARHEEKERSGGTNPCILNLGTRYNWKLDIPPLSALSTIEIKVKWAHPNINIYIHQNLKCYNSSNSQTFSGFLKLTGITSLVTSVSPSAWNVATTGWIFMKFHVWNCYYILIINSGFG
jgi:hypothetical protein